MEGRDRGTRWGVGAGAVAAIVIGIYAWLGVVNGDEGWYVLCARLASEGKLPWHDFAFPQGPAYLYLLAPFVRVIPSLYAARGVSVACAAVGIGLLVATARRVGGKWAAIASSAALLATIPSLPYWLSLTKTYALSFLFLAAILFMLTGATRPGIGLPVTAALAVGLVETRPTGLALAVLVIAALVARSPNQKIRTRVLWATALTALPFVALVLLEWPRAKWGLIDYHQLGPKNGSGIGRYVNRDFAVAHAWPGPMLLGALATIVAILDPEMRALLRRRLDLVAFAVGIVLFVLLHETGAAFFSEEYLSPVIAPIVVTSILVLMRAARRANAGENPRRLSVALRGVLVVGIVVTAITGGHRYYLGSPGWKGDPAGLSAIANCVQRHSAASDTVFALSLEEVVVEAHRRPVQGVTLGMFSYENVSTKRAQELRILNSTLLAARFNGRRPPAVIVLTLDDIFETQRAGYFSHRKFGNLPLYVAFQKYRPVCHATLIRHVFKNIPVEVTVYARKPKSP
jgi:Dolichyl-phosphate-mannose-protein mannosyltransferase